MISQETCLASYLASQAGCFGKLAGFLTPRSCNTSAYMVSNPRSCRRMARASPPDASLSLRASRSDERSRLRVVVDVMSVVSRPNTGKGKERMKVQIKKRLAVGSRK